MKRTGAEGENVSAKRRAIEEGPLATLLPELLEHVLTVDQVIAAGDLAFIVSLVCKRMADAVGIVLRKRYVEDIHAPLHVALETRQVRIDPTWGDRVHFGHVVHVYATMLEMYNDLALPERFEHINGRQLWARFTKLAARRIGARIATAFHGSPMNVFHITFQEAQSNAPIILKYDAEDKLVLACADSLYMVKTYVLWLPINYASLKSLHPRVVKALDRHTLETRSWWAYLRDLKQQRHDDERRLHRLINSREQGQLGEIATNLHRDLWGTILWYYPHAWARCSPKTNDGFSWIAGLLHGTILPPYTWCGDSETPHLPEYTIYLSGYVRSRYHKYIAIDSETGLVTLRLRQFCNNSVEHSLHGKGDAKTIKIKDQGGLVPFKKAVSYGPQWVPPPDQVDEFLSEAD